VKRAYPTASDQRFSIVPRGPADIQLAPEPGASPSPGAAATPPRPGSTPPPGAISSSGVGGNTGPGSGSPGGSGVPGESPDSSAGTDVGDIPDVTIEALPSLVGQRVRVAGTVWSVDGPLATIDDGTGQVVVRAPGPLDLGDAPIGAGDVINAVGYVSERDVGGLEIVVTDPADLVRAPALGAEAGATGDPPGTPTPTSDAAYANETSPTTTGATGGAPLLAGLLVGLTVAGALGSGGAVAVLRRRRGLTPKGVEQRAPGPLAAPPNASPAGPEDLEKQANEGPDPPPGG